MSKSIYRRCDTCDTPVHLEELITRGTSELCEECFNQVVYSDDEKNKIKEIEK